MGFLEVTLGLRAAALPMVQASFGVVFLGQGVVFLGDPRHVVFRLSVGFAGVCNLRLLSTFARFPALVWLWTVFVRCFMSLSVFASFAMGIYDIYFQQWHTSQVNNPSPASRSIIAHSS